MAQADVTLSSNGMHSGVGWEGYSGAGERKGLIK